jgi:hypothetical protein
MDLSEYIKKVKKNPAESSIQNYISPIRQLHKRMFGTTKIENFDFLDDVDKVLDTIKDFKSSTKRNYLASIVIFKMANDPDYQDDEEYKDSVKGWEYYILMLKLNSAQRRIQRSSVLTEKQIANWITPQQYNDILDTYKKCFIKNDIFNTCGDEEDLKLLQEYVLLKIYQTIPCRNSFSTIKIISVDDYDKIKEEPLIENLLVVTPINYYFVIKNNKLKKYRSDRCKIIIDQDIQKAIKLLIAKQGGSYLFYGSTGEPLTKNALTKVLTGVFHRFHPDKQVSTTQLRVIWKAALEATSDDA